LEAAPVTVQSASLLAPAAASCCCSCARCSSSVWIGASSGIGQEFAPQAAVNGINVVPLARREERVIEVAAEPTARYDVQARAVAPPSAVTGSSTRSPRDRRPGIVLVSAMPAAGGLPCTANDSATKAHPTPAAPLRAPALPRSPSSPRPPRTRSAT